MRPSETEPAFIKLSSATAGHVRGPDGADVKVGHPAGAVQEGMKMRFLCPCSGCAVHKCSLQQIGFHVISEHGWIANATMRCVCRVCVSLPAGCAYFANVTHLDREHSNATAPVVELYEHSGVPIVPAPL